jgi:DNA-binding transcriptional MerR regulator
MKTNQLARRLGVSPNTIRNWADEFSEFLSESLTSRSSGTRRIFSDRDSLILATIADLRAKGLTQDQIIEALQKEKLVEALPGAATPEEEDAQKSIALVPVAELHRALDQIKVMSGEIERLTHERDRAAAAREDTVEQYSKQIAELREQLGRARGVVIGGIAVIVLLVIVGLILIALILFLLRYIPQP